MAEPPAAASSEVAVSQHDVLLATKLRFPGPQPGFVPRPRLVAALDTGLRRRLILVCAPAGFGKTALLADWVRSGRLPAAWLSLDAADNDPARFWRHAAAALDQVRPGVAERTGPVLGPPAPASFDALVTALINELAARPQDDEALLILDDYHLIDAPAVHQSMTFLLDHLPPGLHLVLASRSDPPLPLARLRAGGQLAELRVGELRFTGAEAAALLRNATGSELADSAVTTLSARTEGWAAGLQLAGLSLRGQADPAGFVAAFGGSHRHVLDYLAEEVLDGQSQEVRQFLLETSVLDRLSGPLCDAVTGRIGSQAILEAIERSGLFLVPLDDVRGWWRYHRLFCDLLRARLQRERPGQLPALHRAAAAWCEEHDLADDAIRHAVAAGEMTWAADLIERYSDALLERGENATVHGWLSALPAELSGSRPRLLVAQSWMAVARGDMNAAQAQLDAAERLPAARSDVQFEPSVGRSMSWLANVPATIALNRASLAVFRGDADRAIDLISHALSDISESEWMLASHAQGYLGAAQWQRGRLAEAERALSSSVSRWRSAGQPVMSAWGSHLLAQVERAQGSLGAAFDTYQRALEDTAPPDQPGTPAAGIGYLGMAQVEYQRNELDSASQHLTEGIRWCRQLNYPQFLADGLAMLGWMRQARGDQAGARAAMAEAARAAPNSTVAGLLNTVPAQRARLLLAQGNIDSAERWVQERGLDPADEPSYPREPDYLVLARVLLAQAHVVEARQLLERLHAPAAAQGRTGSVIEIQALNALAMAASGDEAGAVDCLASALILAGRQGHVRVFADEGPAMTALLGRVVAAQKAQRRASAVPLAFLAGVLRASGTDGDQGPAAAGPGLVDPLTARELQVLALLAKGTPNPRIAQELVVTLDTVKKHVSHVLAKLGAANRTEAVARARQLGLLP